MTTGYGSAAAYRQALEARLRGESEATGRDLNWLRRRHVFVRVLHRLAAAQPDLWVLKGGLAVELRRPGLARATKDLDLAMRTAGAVDANDPSALRDLLQAAVGADPDGDRFETRVEDPNRMAEDAYGRPAWRFRVTASLAGRRFTEKRIDVVVRPEELTGVTTVELRPGQQPPPGAPVRNMHVTDLRQQFAEKLHALTRTYASGESSRVKDLIDLVLLVHDDVPADRQLVRTVQTVFAVGATHEVPQRLGEPPVGWSAPYRAMASSLGVEPAEVDEANALVGKTWQAALRNANRKDA